MISWGFLSRTCVAGIAKDRKSTHRWGEVLSYLNIAGLSFLLFWNEISPRF